MDSQAMVKLQQAIRDAIERATQAQDWSQISALAALAGEIEETPAQWRQRFEQITASTTEEPEDAVTSYLRPITGDRRSIEEKNDRKKWGKKARQSFADANQLRTLGGREYSTHKGSRVAMAAAREDQRGNRWFLGLPDKGGLSCLVLLCEGRNGLVDFVIPTSSISNIWPRLSRSGTEVKLNIKRVNGKFFLQVPGYGPFDITGFRGRYTYLN